MKAINKLFGIVFAMLSMAWTARGVEPVAVWNGDLGEEKEGFSFALNGNTLNADGTITMSAISNAAKLGVTLRSTTAAYSASTIIFEVEGMTIPSADGAAIVSTYSNQSGYDDYCGMRVTNSGETYGIWNNNKWGNTSNCQTHRVNSAAELGAATRVALVYVQNRSKGTQGYMMINGTLTKIFGATGLVSTTAGMGANGWNILGAGCDTTANRSITKMAGAKLKNVAIFNSELSTSDIADYEFPDPAVEYETFTYDKFLTTTFVDTGWNFDLSKLESSKITGTMSGGNIANKPAASTGYWVEGPDASGVMKFQMQVYQYNHATDHYLKVVEVELKNGDNGNIWIRGVRAGYIDGGATDPKGSIKITNWNASFVTNETAGGYGVNKVVINVPVNPLDPPVEVDCGTEYSMSDANAVEGNKIVLKFADAGGKLLIDEAPSRKYTIKCAGKMEILGDDYTMTQTDFNKLTLTQVAGSLTIDAKGGLEMTDAIKSAIRAATSNKTYTFIGEGNKGVALDYGDNNDGTQLKTHIVFDGGAHTLKYRCENAGLKFGANATADNPTIRVTNNATLTFAARNLCGWTSGNSNADGIIRVDNGSKLYLNPTGGTLYWAQQFYLEPGAQLTYSDGASFRINGGTNYAPQIFVPASTVDMTDTPAKIIRSGNNDFCVNGQGTKGMAISVGANSKLVIESGIALDNANCDVVKLGGGVLEVTGNIVNQNFIVNDGSVSLLGSITKLTFGENGALDISEGTPTITGSLVTATEKQLELTVDSPVHMMPVITLPAGADKKGWTAIVNGKSTVNDLIAEGNTLKLKWKIPPTIELDEDSIVINPASDWNGGTVMVDISTLNRGDYTGEDDIKYILRFGDKTVFGEEKDDKANFELDPAEFTAGNIYRGEFVVGYGEDGDEVPGAEVTLYMGEKGYKEAVDWVNETVDTFKTTGSYDPDEGAKIEDDKLAFNSAGDVVFTPNEHADYVERCDSVFTFEILAEEAIDDDDSSIEDDVQAGVKLVANNKGGVKFQFISGDEWIDGPDASLDTMYEVKVSFHYAKEDGDSDTVTYEVKDLTQGALVVERREGTDEKASEIVFSDGTKLGYLKGTLQVEAATPKERGMEPGGKEMPLKADNQKDADEEAKKIPVLVPNDENVVAALDTDAKKDVYKALFKVVAVKKDGAYVAQVVFTDTAISTIKEDEKNILSEVMEKLGSLLGEEGELDDIKGQPGLYYGIGSDGELVNMGEAQPEEWKIADKDGNIIGLKVKKAANAKRGFYKVLCSPVKSSSK